MHAVWTLEDQLKKVFCGRLYSLCNCIVCMHVLSSGYTRNALKTGSLTRSVKRNQVFVAPVWPLHQELKPVHRCVSPRIPKLFFPGSWEIF